MDRKFVATTGGVGLLLAGAFCAAWQTSGTVFDPERTPSEPPALLAIEPLQQCAWRPIEAEVVEAATELNDPDQVADEPAVDDDEPVVDHKVANQKVADQKVDANRGKSVRANDVIVSAEPSAERNPLRKPSRPSPPPAITAVAPLEEVVDNDEGDEIDEDVDQDEPADIRPADVAAQPNHLSDPPTTLPWAQANPRSPEMMAVLMRADQRVRHGFDLARRGALYSSRSDFIAALQIIAQANDAQQNTNLYTRSLSSGLTALREASVFMRQHTDRTNVDLARIVASHRTPILKDAELDELSGMTAARQYYSYAQEQLAAAGASEVVGSMALFGLAKVALIGSVNQALQPIERTAQAMVLYQASLITNPQNFLSANELAVLEVGNGNLERARELLIHSVSLSPHVATWRNLVVVHTRLGEKDASEEAKAKYEELSRVTPPPSKLNVQWLDPETFAATSGPADPVASVPPAAANAKGQSAARPAAKAPAAKPAASTARKSPTEWITRGLSR